MLDNRLTLGALSSINITKEKHEGRGLTSGYMKLNTALSARSPEAKTTALEGGIILVVGAFCPTLRILISISGVKSTYMVPISPSLDAFQPTPFDVRRTQVSRPPAAWLASSGKKFSLAYLFLSAQHTSTSVNSAISCRRPSSSIASRKAWSQSGRVCTSRAESRAFPD